MQPVYLTGAIWPMNFMTFDIIIKAEEVDKNIPSYSIPPLKTYAIFAGDYEESYFESIIFENEETEE